MNYKTIFLMINLKRLIFNKNCLLQTRLNKTTLLKEKYTLS